MSQSQRQSELFAGNDWEAIYRAFTEVNLNAYDFATIRQAMVDYIRRNYPEDFNDWIESSEFVAIIDLLAYMGQSLAFRTDINARENFLSVARRRESILRLSRSLSYNAKRNYPARGLVKLTEIRTTYDVFDSTGKNLNNLAIRWDDPNNSDWFEQWILVLNASLIETNPFGVPLKAETLDGIETQLYRVNNVQIGAGNYPFATTVNNQSYNFDIVNADFNTTYGFVEQEPDPNGSFHLVYRSDGNGNSSPDTGFFLYFKQGNLQKVDYSIGEPQENRTITIDTNNINETDIWLQSVDDLGSILPDGTWTRVGYVPSDDFVKISLTAENVTYNSIDPDVQNIYQVVTLEQDQVSLRFGDGRFGKSPVGNLRAWYRTSTNNNLNIRPEDMQGMSISIPFYARTNTEKRINLTFSLQGAVTNGVSSETNAELRRRASKVYSTQGRMVSGSDYNELPIQTNLALKLKAVNRIYSGQSRYLDLNDPTGNYQNTKVVSDDGAFYLDLDSTSIEVDHTVSDADELMTNYLQSIVSSISLSDFYTNWLYSQIGENEIGITNYYTNEYLAKSETARLIKENIQLNRTFAIGFDNTTADSGWYVLSSNDVNPDLTAGYEFQNSFDPGPNSWLVYLEYTADVWRITSRGLNYVFESEKDCRFFFSSDYKSIDPNTGRAGSDTISILQKPNSLNQVVLYDNGQVMAPLQNDLILKLEDMFIYPDGFQEPSRIKVRFDDKNDDGIADIPYTYKVLLNINTDQNVVVHQSTTDTDGYPIEVLITRLEKNSAGNIVTQLLPGVYGYFELPGKQVQIYKGNTLNLIPSSSDICLDPDTLQPATLSIGSSAQTVKDPNDTGSASFMIREGVNDLIYMWKHFAPSNHRIDPAISNIIDIFVLTRAYSDAMTTWSSGGGALIDQPAPPSDLALRMMFSDLEEYKMFSDEIIWRPVKFKLLFGQSADPQLQAKFKIVKLAGTTMSDGEIKSKTIDAIRTFFDVTNWDFGETFYYSELAAYIHRQLSTSISSVELVPVQDDSFFGDLREIRCNPDELFFTTAQVSDIDIITANTPANLRIR